MMEMTSNAGLWASAVTIAAVWTVTVVSPGPNFLATVHAALAHSRRAGVQVALGISAGTTLWATASLLGLGLLFQSAGWLYHAVRIAGAGYLIYLGVRTLMAARHPAVPPGSAGSRAPVRGLRAVRRGLLTDLGNPKAAAFFTSTVQWNYRPHWIACPVSSAGGGATARPAHRRGAANAPRGRDKRPCGRPSEAPGRRCATPCDAPASRRRTRLARNLGGSSNGVDNSTGQY